MVPFWVPYYNTGPNTGPSLGDPKKQKGTIILTIPHMIIEYFDSQGDLE